MTKHRLYKHTLYNTWKQMNQRCYNEKSPLYEYYGGRGIAVCLDWMCNFQSFYNWSIKNGWSKKLSIDRIDNNGDYTPNNCRFVCRKIQALNRRNTRFVTAFNETKKLLDWVDDNRCVVSYQALIYRINNGWPTEKAISQKSQRIKK